MLKALLGTRAEVEKRFEVRGDKGEEIRPHDVCRQTGRQAFVFCLSDLYILTPRLYCLRRIFRNSSCTRPELQTTIVLEGLAVGLECEQLTVQR